MNSPICDGTSTNEFESSGQLRQAKDFARWSEKPSGRPAILIPMDDLAAVVIAESARSFALITFVSASSFPWRSRLPSNDCF
jgi:hypothetical protein